MNVTCPDAALAEFSLIDVPDYVSKLKIFVLFGVQGFLLFSVFF